MIRFLFTKTSKLGDSDLDKIREMGLEIKELIIHDLITGEISSSNYRDFEEILRAMVFWGQGSFL